MRFFVVYLLVYLVFPSLVFAGTDTASSLRLKITPAKYLDIAKTDIKRPEPRHGNKDLVLEITDGRDKYEIQGGEIVFILYEYLQALETRIKVLEARQ